MRRILLILLATLSTCVLAQQGEADLFLKEILTRGDILRGELKDSLIAKDFSPLLSQTPNGMVYGFIGDDYQRIRVKLISVIKDINAPDVYRVYGKNMVKANVCEFQAELRLTNIRRYDDINYGVDETYRDSSIQGRFLLCGTYRLLEDPRQKHAGIMSGAFASYFYIDRNGAIRYDDIEDVADGFSNNLFVGEWASYGSKTRKRCNWGDYRIPKSGDLDIGAAEFSPDDKYLANGWQDIRNMFNGRHETFRAMDAEKKEWWK